MYIVKWKDSGLYYNKVTGMFDTMEGGTASIIMAEELEMMLYKWDEDIVAIPI